MTPLSSQEFESYVPVFDAIPDEWENARPFVVEQLKKLANAVNIREIGWFLDEELLSGKQFIPSANTMTNQRFRTILRYVVDTGPLVIGANNFAVGPGLAVPIIIDENFTLLHMYGAAQRATAPFASEPLPNGSDTITLDNANLTITVAAVWDRSSVVIEYIQEL